MILRKIVHKTLIHFDQFLVPFWCRFGAVLQNKTILISGRFLRNNDTFEFQEFRALEIGSVFEVRTFCSTDDLEGKSVSVYSFVFPYLFLFTAFITILFAAVTSTTSKTRLEAQTKI